jgi:arylsulfatase A-like enzyme
MNLDVHATLLELAGIAPAGPAVSRTLLAPDPKRLRVGEYPFVFDKPFGAVRNAHPGWQPGRFGLKLRALYEGDHKLILAEDGSRQLYDVRRDPLETNDLSELQTARADRLEKMLSEIGATLLAPGPPAGPAPALSAEQRELLRELGYLSPDSE